MTPAPILETAASAVLAPASASVWTCPFCPLLCDVFHAAPVAAGGPLGLVGSDCRRAAVALARFGATASAAGPRIGGRPCDPADALAAAARLLADSRQPLFGGLGTDVAGARALYPLACETGAIADAAHGAALQQGLSALQDKGGFTTTLAEVRGRADLIVCVGGLPSARYPEFFTRCGVAEPTAGGRRIVVVGGDERPPDTAEAPTGAAGPGDVSGVPVEWLPLDGDLFDTLARLAACVDGNRPRAPAAVAGGPSATGDGAPPNAIEALAGALHAASYAVLVWQAPQLPPHGALAVEAIDRLVAVLNRRGRAAALPLGGDDGAATVNQVFGWLSGLPLRSRAGPLGLEHEPLRFDAARLLADGAVDALLWIASYGTEPLPPVTGLPTVVLGHPSFADRLPVAPESVFIPVSTPGIGSAGHLFRTDGAVLMPLSPVYADALPTVADVVGRLASAVKALRAEVPAAGAAPVGGALR